MIDETTRTGTDEGLHFTARPRRRTGTTTAEPIATFGELRLIRHSSFTAPGYDATRERVVSPATAARYLRPYADRCTTETFWLLALDCNAHVIGDAPVEVAVGTMEQVASGPREIFRAAIVAGANCIIVAHYHPSPSGHGQPEPSDADVHATRALTQVGAIVGIPVQDHIIMGPDGHTSLADRGVIDEATAGEHPVSDLIQRGFSEFDALMAALCRERGQDPTPALYAIATKNAGERARRGIESGR